MKNNTKFTPPDFLTEGPEGALEKGEKIIKRGSGFKKNSGFIKASQAFMGHPSSKVFQAALFRHKVINAWGQAVSQFFEAAEQLTRPMDFKNGVLVIACLSKELAYKIKNYAARIIYVLNQMIGQSLVYVLRVEI